MNSLFYAKMAVSNIRKNKKIFFPYIIMGIFSVMMYYMMVSLMNNDGIRKMPYSDNILALLPIGLWVARIFIVVFLFYINSFLMKQRLKEIGLYNILGMEKRHIAVMLFLKMFLFYHGLCIGHDSGNGIFQIDVSDIDENDCGKQCTEIPNGNDFGIDDGRLFSGNLFCNIFIQPV